MRSNIAYLIQLLKEYNLSDTDVVSMLTLVYENRVLYNNQNLENVFTRTKYSDAFYQFSEEIYGLTIQDLKEWKNSLV